VWSKRPAWGERPIEKVDDPTRCRLVSTGIAILSVEKREKHVLVVGIVREQLRRLFRFHNEPHSIDFDSYNR
jgi:hypothetical protein